MIARHVSGRAVFLMLVAGLVGGAAACGPRGSAAGDAAADSSAVADSVAPPDSLAARADSTATDADSGSTKARAPAPTSAETKAPTVGRDSAFGPKFVVDSTGKVTPIGTKKKP